MTFMCFPTFSDMYKQYHLSYEFFDLLSNFFRKLNKRFEICTAAPSRKIKRIGKEEDWKYYDFYVCFLLFLICTNNIICLMSSLTFCRTFLGNWIFPIMNEKFEIHRYQDKFQRLSECQRMSYMISYVGRILSNISFVFWAMEFQEKLLFRFTDL